MFSSYIIRTTKLFLHELLNKKQSYTNEIFKLTNSIEIYKLEKEFIEIYEYWDFRVLIELYFNRVRGVNLCHDKWHLLSVKFPHCGYFFIKHGFLFSIVFQPTLPNVVFIVTVYDLTGSNWLLRFSAVPIKHTRTHIHIYFIFEWKHD